jgi:murein DD-endopeptidase MepM/ murein hydrolase activator NlpD
MKKKIYSQNILLNSEKKENIALFNLIFIILILFSVSIFSLFDAKNQFYLKKSEKKSDFGSEKSNKYIKLKIPVKGLESQKTFSFLKKKLDYYSDLEKSSIPENSFLISDNLQNLFFKLKEEFFFEDSKLNELNLLLNDFKHINKDFLQSEAFGILDCERNLIELRIKIDEFRFLKINKNKINNNNSFSGFKIKKIFTNQNISDLRNLDSDDYISSEEGNDNSFNLVEAETSNDLIQYIGLNSINGRFDKKLIFFEQKVSNYADLKNLLSNLSLNKENLNHLLNLVSQAKNKSNLGKSDLSFKGMFALKDDGSFSKPYNKIKISYSENLNNFSGGSQKELIYFSVNDKSYFLFKKNGVNSFYDSNGKSLHFKKMFAMPLSGAYRISSNFGLRFHPVLHYTRMHNGVDLAIRHGHPIKAPADGIVEFASRKGSYGNYLVINHGNGYKTGYGHLSAFDKKIKPGKSVKKNQLIAFVGNTGTSSGPHLHYEIIKNGRFIDPLRNNPNISEKLDKNDLRKLRKIIELINVKILEQKKFQDSSSEIENRINNRKIVDKI